MKELREEANGFIQIFEEDCFGPDTDPVTVDCFRVIKDSWSVNEAGRDVRRIHKAIALTFLSNDIR